MFLNAISLVIIISMIHKQRVMESSYKCEVCGKSFPSRDELYDHIHQIHGYRLEAKNRFLGIGILLICTNCDTALGIYLYADKLKVANLRPESFHL
jgi:uncharacterized C2H2 Zn-finger protein